MRWPKMTKGSNGMDGFRITESIDALGPVRGTFAAAIGRLPARNERNNQMRKIIAGIAGAAVALALAACGGGASLATPAHSSGVAPATSALNASWQQGYRDGEVVARDPSSWVPPGMPAGDSNVACQWAMTARVSDLVTYRYVADNVIDYMRGCEVALAKHGWTA